YFSLDPAFVVNFQGKSRARYLQVNIDGMTRNEEVKLDVTKHLPQIRNNVVLLLSSQEYEFLMKPEGKDTLRKSLLKEINNILENETGAEDAVEDIYFTSFVMQ
ncbi:MAG: flagellar basal body-associated FliL family protein, partial [Gammaproteobacteria bacterium]|nr:flagellar basal body-associated FliL family protein [Gammaproteobacteria bacterium]